MSETSIVPAQPAAPALLRPIARPAEFIEVHKETAKLIQEALEEGRDYGKIPKTEKNTLLKPGAERLCLAFGLRASFEIMSSELDHDRVNEYSGKNYKGTSQGFYRFVMRCALHAPDGREVGQGVGSCSTLESKYISRPRDSENTVLKMAKKRALVDAVLSTLGLSDRFSQDVEEMRDEAPAQPAAPSFDDKVKAAGDYFKKIIKGTAAQFTEFKEACEANQWPQVAADAEAKRIATFAGLMRFANGEEIAPQEEEVTDAEFREEGAGKESSVLSAEESPETAGVSGTTPEEVE